MHAPDLADASWPPPFDAGAAERLIERVTEAAPEIGADARAAPLLRALGGHSPFLADLAVREAGSLATFLREGPEAAMAAAMATVRAIDPAMARPQVAAALREAKRIAALAVALADIGGLWDLDQVTGALSDFAEAALDRAVAHLLRGAHDAGELRLRDPAEPGPGSGFIVLGMGKLGARELNYSSDIDLILIYDPASGIYTPRTEGDVLRAFASRLARDLVALMETRDGNGYVFRTDLRLRPDPAVTPPAVSLPAAIAYYESMGLNWERAALSKARPVAGDRAAGHAFLQEIRPFIWRRGLDFAAVADIEAMKRRIDQHKGGALPSGTAPEAIIAGHDVKLGEGGIREIEFLAQTLQLVWGGRDPALRDPTTLGALAGLARAGQLGADAAAELAEAYRFLRRVEHRLQMIADRQTHRIPEKPAELARVASFLGYASPRAFAGALLAHMHAVRRRYREMFEAAAGERSAHGELDFRGDDPRPPGTVAALAALGFAEPEHVIAAVRGWQAGRLRALRSQRARELLDTLLPEILGALATQKEPDLAFRRFDEFLARLPAGVQILSLFQHNRHLIARVAAVLGAAPSLSDHLAQFPAALDGLLSPEAAPDPVPVLHRRLRDSRTLEDTIAIVRRTVREEDFAISVATLEGRLDADAAGLRRSVLADAALGVLLPAVKDDFAARYGSVPGGEMAVVLLGKAGGREMMAGSDLDLMLIYDHPEDATESTGGARSLPAAQWFVRACHSFVAALTARGPDGALYEVDMRLRPSGNKGPVAVSLGAFRRYHAESAWTWERMALTRARPAAGPPALREKAARAIAAAIRAAGPPEQVRADASAMRARMLRELPPAGPWDVKLRPGGLVEVEFIAQALSLIHAAALPPADNDTSTRGAFRRLAAAGLLAAGDASLLIGGARSAHT